MSSAGSSQNLCRCFRGNHVPDSACFFLCLAGVLPAAAGSTVVFKDTPVEVYFSPHGGAQAGVLEAIRSARKNIRVSAFIFSSAPMAEALVAAKKRGVDVEAVLDGPRTDKASSKVSILTGAGIGVYVDRLHEKGNYHNKTMIIDGKRVLTGSFNFSPNAENLLIIDSPELAARYLEEYAKHKVHAKKL